MGVGTTNLHRMSLMTIRLVDWTAVLTVVLTVVLTRARRTALSVRDVVVMVG